VEACIHYVVFLGKTLNSHNASPHPGGLESNPVGGVKIPQWLQAKETRDKCWPDEAHGLYTEAEKYNILSISNIGCIMQTSA